MKIFALEKNVNNCKKQVIFVKIKYFILFMSIKSAKFRLINISKYKVCVNIQEKRKTIEQREIFSLLHTRTYTNISVTHTTTQQFCGTMEGDDKCRICKIVVADDDDESLCCDFCEKWVHYGCIKKPQRPFSELADLPKWYCSNRCKSKGEDQMSDQKQIFLMLSDIKKTVNEIPAIKQAMEDLKKKELVNIHNTIEDLKKKYLTIIKGTIEELRINIEFHNQQYIDLKKEVQESIDNQNEDITKLRANNNNLSREVQLIKSELNRVKQDRLKRDAICFGIPYAKSEDASAVIQQLLRDYQLDVDGIESCRRVSQKKGDGQISKTPPIVITFREAFLRDRLINKTKKITINADKFGDENPTNGKSQKVYFKELLTSENKKLFESTKVALKDKVRYIWCKNGGIFVRLQENGKSWFISNIELLVLK